MEYERCAYVIRGGRSRNQVGAPCGAVAVGDYEGMPICGTHRAQLRSRARDHEEREAFAREQDAERAAQAAVAEMLPGGNWREKAESLRQLLSASGSKR